MRALLILCALLATMVARPAAAFWHGVPPAPPPVGCPFGTTYPDGCPGATPNGSFYMPDAFTNTVTGFRQSGQVYTSTHPQPWNVAGVDYPIGYDTTTTFTPASTYSGWAALGCVYSAATTPAPPLGQPWVFCNTTSTNPVLIQNISFAPAENGGKCVPIHWTGNQIGPVTIRNSKFVDGPGCYGFTGGVAQSMISFSSGATANLTLDHDDFDGNWAAYGSFQTGVYDGAPVAYNVTNCALTVTYSAFHNMANIPMSGFGNNCTTTMQYNWFGTFAEYDDAAHPIHGAIYASTPVVGVTPVLARLFTFNVCFYEGGTRANTGTTCFSTLAQPSRATVYNSEEMDYNTMVSNTTTNHGGTIGAPTFTTSSVGSEILSEKLIGSYTQHTNYLDPSGAGGCFSNLGAAQSSGGNWSISSGVLTVGPSGLAGLVYVGSWWADVGNNLYGQITSQLTGTTGGAGTYQLSTSSSAPGSTQGRTVNTPITTLDIPTSGANANVNLLDGTAVFVASGTTDVRMLQWGYNTPPAINGAAPPSGQCRGHFGETP